MQLDNFLNYDFFQLQVHYTFYSFGILIDGLKVKTYKETNQESFIFFSWSRARTCVLQHLLQLCRMSHEQVIK